MDNPLARHGGLSYLEIPTIDPRRSATFYERIFGWQIDQRSADDFRFADPRGLFIGRLARGRQPSREPGLLLYIYVDSLEVAVAGVVNHGGDVVEPPRPEGDVRVAQVRDPGGNLLGLWQFGR